MRVLVTGSSGYIGSHIVHELIERGHHVYGIDNFSTGFKEFTHPGIHFSEGDLSDRNFVESVFKAIPNPHELSIIHAAGLKFAGESVHQPLEFYKTNAVGTEVLLSEMQIFGARKIVFSSSCSVYGSLANGAKVKEDGLPNPTSPYGRSKFFAEQILNDAISAKIVEGVSLRYFNVIGNGPISAHDRSPYNLIPNIFRSLESATPINIFGNDYATSDGTCIRDYVDVVSLAKVHVTALELLDGGTRLELAYNLGSSIGLSTLEVVTAAMSATGLKSEIRYQDRRLGDPEIVQADVSLAAKDLAWKHDIPIEEMLLSSWVSWKSFTNIRGN
jgi:UDP-glucose 4-epimerase